MAGELEGLSEAQLGLLIQLAYGWLPGDRRDLLVRLAVYQYPVPPSIVPGVLDPIERITDYWLPLMCGKPVDSLREKDNAYGNGMLLGDVIAQAITPPALDVTTVGSIGAGFLTIAMLGMVVSTMSRGLT